MYDLILAQGIIYDGCGNSGKRQDIGINGEKISAIGNLSKAACRKYISVKGLSICPGFIDIHSHSDVYYLIHPQAECKIRQGVTTEVIGNCGASAAPLAGNFKKYRERQWRTLGIKVNWSSFKEYINLIKNKGTAVNVVPLVGHGNIRGTVKGFIRSKLTAREKLSAAKLLHQALAQGAWGLSSGLIYRPSMYADNQELIELTKIVTEYHGLYTTHIRGEGDSVVPAVAEAVNTAAASGVPLQISHLKVSGKKNWKKLSQIFRIIEQAREKGVKIDCDRYPYIAGNTDLDILLPDGYHKMKRSQLIKHLRKITAEGWAQEVIIGKITSNRYRWTEGLTLAQIAKKMKKSPAAVVIDLCRAENTQVQAMFFGMSERNLMRILRKPYVMIGSDSSLRTMSGPLALGYPHPRTFGTFPRVLARYTGPQKLSLAQAIYKMTGMPAQKIGLKDRGKITPGNYADLVIFNPKLIKDRATYTKPFQYPEGIVTVLVNGQVVFEDGACTGNPAGKVLLK